MSTVSIGIRRAVPADAKGVAAVHDDAWWTTYRGVIPNRELERLINRRGPKWWRDALDSGLGVLVLEYDRTIVGYATIGHSRIGRLPHKGEIYELYLTPTYQGVGLGRRLFKAAKARLDSRGLRPLLVWVLEDNVKACRFYEAMGGEIVAEGSERFGGRILPKIGYSWET